MERSLRIQSGRLYSIHPVHHELEEHAGATAYLGERVDHLVVPDSKLELGASYYLDVANRSTVQDTT